MPTVKREDLYEQVWSRPMRSLAADYGVSDVAMAKACRRALIPVPPRGYWNKVQHGKHVMPRPALPSGKEAKAIIEFTPSPPRYPVTSDPVMASRLQEVVNSGDPIPVPDTLRNPHQVVRLLRDADMQPRPKQTYSTADRSWLDVERASKGRALRILDALFKALEARGHAVGEGGAVIEGQRIPIAVTERTDKVLHVASAREKADKEKHYWKKIPTWDYVPNGRLSIAADVHVWPSLEIRKRWSEGRGRSLEDSLPDVLVGLIAVGMAMRLQQEEKQAEEARRQEEARRRAEEARRLRLENARDEDILASAKAFRRAGEVRALIRAVEERIAAGEGRDSEVRAWLDRANRLADGLDPTSAGLANMVADHQRTAEVAADKVPPGYSSFSWG